MPGYAAIGRAAVPFRADLGPSRLDELQDEFVLRLGWLGRVAVARVAGVAQEVARREQAKAGALDLPAQERLFDPVQGARLRNAGARSTRMVGDDVEAAGLQRGEDGA